MILICHLLLCCASIVAADQLQLAQLRAYTSGIELPIHNDIAYQVRDLTPNLIELIEFAALLDQYYCWDATPAVRSDYRHR